MSSKNRVVDLRKRTSAPVERRTNFQPAPKRQSALKVRKRRIRAVVSAMICVFLVGFGYAIHLASYLPQFSYSAVTVRGTSVLLPSDVQAFAVKYFAEHATGFISGDNILALRAPALELALGQHFHRVKSVHVEPDSFLSNRLNITIQERTSYAQWCDADNACFLMDENGLVFSPNDGAATSTLVTPYVFSGPLATSTNSYATLLPIGGIFASGHFPGVMALLQVLGQAGFISLGAQVQNEQDISIPLLQGFYVKASFGEDPQFLAKNLKLVLSADALKDKVANLEYVDLRFGNRVYYKVRGQVQTQ